MRPLRAIAIRALSSAAPDGPEAAGGVGAPGRMPSGAGSRAGTAGGSAATGPSGVVGGVNSKAVAGTSVTGVAGRAGFTVEREAGPLLCGAVLRVVAGVAGCRRVAGGSEGAGTGPPASGAS
jgi:hypothetical protein